MPLQRSYPSNALGKSSPLYPVTVYIFLAIFVAILGVSLAICRYLFLRCRRRRSLVENVIHNISRAWTPTTPTQVQLRKRKPKMWEAIVKDEWEREDGEKEWMDIIPVSVSYLPKPLNASASSQKPDEPPPIYKSGGHRLFRSTRFARHSSSSTDTRLNTLLSSQSVSRKQAMPVISTAKPFTQGNEEWSAVRAAVLIAMPDPSHPACHSLSGSQQAQRRVPGRGEKREMGGWVVEFGVVDVTLGLHGV